ncbi:MAG: hypothetical protein KIT22_02060 [Verrucomicrobiae bacterium]|nr:hypothetical protein [Verrucomicrobiae bacterium]
MNPADRELIQHCLIRYLATRGLRFGTPIGLLVTMLRSAGWPQIGADQVLSELDYLADPTNALGKSFVTSVAKLNPSVSRWVLTAAGREYSEERGLDQ